MSIPILKKTATGQWITRDGFVGAVILKWNAPDDDGAKHYRFIANSFDTIPHDIEHNGEDDAVLITESILKTLIARGVARAMTDEEAKAANDYEDATRDQINDENMARQVVVEEENGKVRTTPAAKIDPASPPKPIPVVIAPQQTADGTKMAAPIITNQGGA